jgi:hypothetical protein
MDFALMLALMFMNPAAADGPAPIPLIDPWELPPPPPPPPPPNPACQMNPPPQGALC